MRDHARVRCWPSKLTHRPSWFDTYRTSWGDEALLRAYHAYVTTTVTITGTGTPIVDPNRAGPGVLVHFESQANGSDGKSEPHHTRLQFDAGRNTVARLAGAGVATQDLDAVFLTHFHSDHLVGLQDLVLTRWILDRDDAVPHLDIVAPNGATNRFCHRMLEIWDDDLAVRSHHNHRDPSPRITIEGFDCPAVPTEVWSNDHVRVLAGPVRHEPVENAVGYRIETPDGVVAISGDTNVCDEMYELSDGATVLVHEAMRTKLIAERPAHLQYIIDYHSDTEELGSLAARLGVPHLLLTHLIPPPQSPEEKALFASEVRAGGFGGNLIVCDDLDSVSF